MVTESWTDLNGDPYPLPTTTARLRVRFRTSYNPEHGELAYRLIAEVTEAVNIDPNVFVYEGVASVPGRDNDQVRYVTVATPVHMQELPIETPTAEAGYHCRRDQLDVYLRSPVDVLNWRTDIARRLRALCEAINSLAQVVPDSEVVWEFDTDEPFSYPGSIPA